MFTVRPTPFLVAIAVVTVAACSTHSHGPDSFDDRQAQLRHAVISRGLAEAPDTQKRMLEDGIVSFPEYESAILATIGCLQDAGIAVTEIARSPDGETIEYTYGGVPESELDALDDTYDRCRNEHSVYVEELYSVQNAESNEQYQERLASAHACIGELGIDLPESSTLADLVDLIAADPVGVSECLESAGF